MLPLLLVSIATTLEILPGAGFIYPFTPVLTNMYAMVLLWRTALRHAGWARAGWICIALLVTTILAAIALWAFVYPECAMRDSIHLPEVLYMLAGTFAWLGFLFLRNSEGANRGPADLRTLLDVTVMELSGAVFAWYFLIRPFGPEFLTDFRLVGIVEVSPFLDIVLFTLASQVLLQRSSVATQRPAAVSRFRGRNPTDHGSRRGPGSGHQGRRSTRRLLLRLLDSGCGHAGSGRQPRQPAS